MIASPLFLVLPLRLISSLASPSSCSVGRFWKDQSQSYKILSPRAQASALSGPDSPAQPHSSSPALFRGRVMPLEEQGHRGSGM